MMKKKIFIQTLTSICLILTPIQFFAQENSTDDQIALPDVTTIISGDEIQIGKDALPEFSDLVPNTNTSSSTGPTVSLPDAQAPVANISGTTPNSVAKEKDIFAEGQIGGGYPGYFTGNFSIYRTTGENPFNLQFFHESVTGYARNSFSDGYFDNSTGVLGDKTFTTSSSVWNFSGSYNQIGDGLQDKSLSLYDMTKQTLDGTAKADIKFGDIFSTDILIDSYWYNRYAGKKSSSVVVPDFEQDASVFFLNPLVKANWTFDSVELALSAKYQLQNNLASDSNIVGYDLDSDGTLELDEKATHRGQFGLSVTCSNETFTVYENAYAVVGSALGENRSIVTPFNVGVQINAKPSFMPRAFALKLEGGLDSFQESYDVLEKQYRFSTLGFIPSETSDWYGLLETSIPVSQKITFGATAEYRKTAFENGVWQANYSAKSSSNLYSFVQSEMETLKTTASVSASAGIFSASAIWTAQWIDIPVLESEHRIDFNLVAQSEDSKYGADASLGFETGDESDKTPFVGLGAFVKLTPSLRIAAQSDDIVKLVTGKEREYAGDYCTRSGSAGLLVKFFF